MIRVVIADDHALVREGVRTVLQRAGDIEVVGEAVDGAGAVALVEALKPDVLVTDISMPGMNGIQAAERLRAGGSATAVVILSMHDDEGLARRALQGGVRGYVLKDAVTEELLLAVRAACHGATFLSPRVSTRLLAERGAGEDPRAAAEAPVGLTPREREVLRLIGAGHTNRSIASQLGISVKTVERHRTALMAKLDTHSIVDLIRVAIRRGLIELDD